MCDAASRRSAGNDESGCDGSGMDEERKRERPKMRRFLTMSRVSELWRGAVIRVTKYKGNEAKRYSVARRIAWKARERWMKGSESG